MLEKLPAKSQRSCLVPPVHATISRYLVAPLYWATRLFHDAVYRNGGIRKVRMPRLCHTLKSRSSMLQTLTPTLVHSPLCTSTALFWHTSRRLQYFGSEILWMLASTIRFFSFFLFFFFFGGGSSFVVVFLFVCLFFVPAKAALCMT